MNHLSPFIERARVLRIVGYSMRLKFTFNFERN